MWIFLFSEIATENLYLFGNVLKVTFCMPQIFRRIVLPKDGVIRMFLNISILLYCPQILDQKNEAQK